MDNCEICLENNVCNKCEMDYFVDENGLCVKNEEFYVPKNETHVEKCEKYYHDDLKLCEDESCLPEYYEIVHENNNIEC